MFPKLSDLINYMFGSNLNLPFQTYGFMVAVAFLAGGLVVRSELKRKEREGRLVAGARRVRRHGTSREVLVHPYQYTWSILIVAMVSAIVGSKLFDLFDNMDAFLRNPVHSVLSFNGFAFLGGFIVTVIVLLFYMRVLRLDWKEVIDATAPAIMIGYAIGRMGCHLSGDGCWGVVNTFDQPDWLSWLPDWLWASNYPHNVANLGVAIPGCSGSHCRMLGEPVFPTSLYESILSFLLFGVLWTMRKKITTPVVLFGLFMVLYGTERIFIEQIRINKKFMVGGIQFTQAELISFLMIVAGLVLIIVLHLRNRRLKT